MVSQCSQRLQVSFQLWRKVGSILREGFVSYYPLLVWVGLFGIKLKNNSYVVKSKVSVIIYAFGSAINIFMYEPVSAVWMICANEHPAHWWFILSKQFSVKNLDLHVKVKTTSWRHHLLKASGSIFFCMKSLLQVIKIKGDEREDLKVLATGVAAALASRKVFFFYLSYSSFALSMTSKLEFFVASKKPETFFFYEIVMLSP